MGKKQRERKQRKLEQKRMGTAPSAWMTSPTSPQARRVMAEMANVNPTRIQQEMEQAMIDSPLLRQEPELAEFDFNASQVDQVMARLLPKYKARLTKAQAKGTDEWEAVYDDLAIEAIDELLPRERRRAILSAYDAMLQRLMLGTDAKTLKLAILVRSALDDKGFPWGAAPLFGEMFEEAKEQARERMETAEQLLAQLLKPLGKDATMQDLEAIMQDPARLAQLTQSLNLTPEQQAQLDELTGDILEEFEGKLYAGHVPLELYTEQELIETAARINRLANVMHTGAAKDQPQYLEAIAGILKQRVTEIVTPERLDRIREELVLTGQKWLAEGNEEGRLLEMESDDLEDIEPAESRFLYAALIGQLRSGEQEAGEYDPEVDATVIDAENALTVDPLDETQKQSLRERLGGLFKKPE